MQHLPTLLPKIRLTAQESQKAHFYSARNITSSFYEINPILRVRAHSRLQRARWEKDRLRTIRVALASRTLKIHRKAGTRTHD